MSDVTYLITGALSDIATEFIHLLGKTNEQVTVIAIDIGQFDKQIYEIHKNLTVQYYKCDLSSRQELNKLLVTLVNKNTLPTYILHFAALKFKYDKIKNFDYERSNKDFQIQVLSIAQVCKVFLNKMIKNGNGKILFMISNVVDGYPPKHLAQYTMVKYSLLGLMKSLALECEDKSFSVCGISPNMVDTKFLSEIDRRIIELISMASPKGSLMQAKDIALKIKEVLNLDYKETNGVNFIVDL